MAGLKRGLGLAVREARMNRNWSQEDLAEAAGVDRTYVSGLERGVRNPALSTIERIAIALEVRVSKLIDIAERT